MAIVIMGYVTYEFHHTQLKDMKFRSGESKRGIEPGVGTAEKLL